MTNSEDNDFTVNLSEMPVGYGFIRRGDGSWAICWNSESCFARNGDNYPFLGPPKDGICHKSLYTDLTMFYEWYNQQLRRFLEKGPTL
jgi:hypothetical protein